MQQDTDRLLVWLRETEKQLKSPLKLRLKSEDLAHQLGKMHELQTDIAEHKEPLEKVVNDTEAIMKESQSPVKDELKKKIKGTSKYALNLCVCTCVCACVLMFSSLG